MGGFRLGVDNFGASTLPSYKLISSPCSYRGLSTEKTLRVRELWQEHRPDMSSPGNTDSYTDLVKHCGTIGCFYKIQFSFRKLKCLCK